MSEHLPWRAGRKVGRTVYDAEGDLIGVMDTREMSALAVRAVNYHTHLLAALKDAVSALVKARALNNQGPCDEATYGTALIASVEAQPTEGT